LKAIESADPSSSVEQHGEKVVVGSAWQHEDSAGNKTFQTGISVNDATQHMVMSLSK